MNIFIAVSFMAIFYIISVTKMCFLVTFSIRMVFSDRLVWAPVSPPVKILC